MRSRVVFLLAAVLLLGGVVAILYAQSQSRTPQPGTNRVDLQTETWVGKRLTRTEDAPNGEKIYYYTYRVEARATAKGLPRYVVDHRYNITYETQGFKPGDSVTLLSTNPESETDSPIWVYIVTYVGSGTRSVTFATTGSVFAPSFMTVNGETDECACGGNGSHDECDCGCKSNGCICTCHQRCSYGNCPLGCSNTSDGCGCHGYCSENCTHLKSSNCPGPNGHNCDKCNPKCGGAPGCYCPNKNTPLSGCGKLDCSCHHSTDPEGGGPGTPSCPDPSNPCPKS